MIYHWWAESYSIFYVFLRFNDQRGEKAIQSMCLQKNQENLPNDLRTKNLTFWWRRERWDCPPGTSLYEHIWRDTFSRPIHSHIYALYVWIYDIQYTMYIIYIMYSNTLCKNTSGGTPSQDQFSLIYMHYLFEYIIYYCNLWCIRMHFEWTHLGRHQFICVYVLCIY